MNQTDGFVEGACSIDGATLTKCTLTDEFGCDKCCCVMQFTESAVTMVDGEKIFEVNGCWGVNAFPDKEHDFEPDCFRNWKPMKFLKDGGDVLKFASSSY